jgi:uncharacterized Zn finger protein
MASVADLVELEALEQLAGPAALARGTVLADAGSVQLATFSPLRVTARVTAGATWEVELQSSHGRLLWSCNCGNADDDVLCEHAVAAAVETWRRSPRRRS